MRRFICNICGFGNTASNFGEGREGAVCGRCHSSQRLRSVISILSRSLFQCDIPLCHFPRLQSIRALGISDSPVIASRLEEHFRYTNTFYHQQPQLDILAPPPDELGRYDFVICSDVLEHVAGPIEEAFRSLHSLLKPGGFLILTVPFGIQSTTLEHFAGIQALTVSTVDGHPIAIGKSVDGRYEVFDDLVFHLGEGATLEHRIFSENDLRQLLLESGFSNVVIDNTSNADFGIEYGSECSLPIFASNGPPLLPSASLSELVTDYAEQKRKMLASRQSLWVRLGRTLGFGPRL
ncbi:MAG: class I SAM-dependent methyltransferase [Acidobacteria bacterium]|nr:class I SAM-dependent methyltransferase [Acidobacteriota bacterium]